MITPKISLPEPSVLGAAAAEGRPSPQAANEEIGKQLEGLFASVLIKTMRETLGEEGLFPGDSADVLGSLFDQHMGEEIARGGGLGVAARFNL